jgi:hypothetical protein
VQSWIRKKERERERERERTSPGIEPDPSSSPSSSIYYLSCTANHSASLSPFPW